MTCDRREVVVSGVGLVTALACDPELFWTRLCAGESAVTTIKHRDVSGLPVQIGAELKDFSPAGEIEPRDSRLMDPFMQYAICAAEDALRDAGLTVGENVDPDQVGAIIGCGIGGATSLEQQAVAFYQAGYSEVSPHLMTRVLTNIATAHLAIRHGITGPTMGISNACTSGANAVGEGLRAIRRGEAEVMICGAAEAPLYPLGIAAFAQARALSRRNDEPHRASRPFDRDRDGFVLGEGAGVVVLESADHARARGVCPKAALIGYGTSTDAYHVTMPDPTGRGALVCMQRALRDAGVEPDVVGYINAHATSTKLGDVSEANAIRAMFGDDQPPCSATKASTAHLLGASAAVEAIICASVVATDLLPPTINLDAPDPRCMLNHITGRALPATTQVAVSNSFGFGGHNASLVFAKA